MGAKEREKEGRKGGREEVLLHFYTEREVGKEGRSDLWSEMFSQGRAARAAAAVAPLKQQHSNGLEQ